MTINSPIFLFCFLPLVFILSRLSGKTKYRNILLAVASLVFYAFGTLRDVPLLLASALINYALGLAIVRKPESKKLFAAAAVVLNIGLLSWYKFSFSALPLGISFFTFSALGYVIDVYRDENNAAEDFGRLFLFISFFPKLIAGPIVKYKDIAPQLDERECTPEMTEQGIKRFITGLSKKLLIAGVLGAVVDGVFTSAASDTRLAWIAAVFYMLQIYYDFSGYSDMAIGLSAMFGFSIAENFDHPYGAASIKEFWRKWHISLSSWFKDYLYIPLGGNRKGKLRTVVNKMLVFIATGIWHGANWTFVFWGLAHGVLASLEEFLPMKRFNENKAGRVLCRIYTLLSVCLLFVIFRADSLSDGFSVIASMFSFSTVAAANALIAKFLTPAALFAALTGILLAGNIPAKIRINKNLGRVLSIALLALCILAMAKTNTTPFIYAQF